MDVFADIFAGEGAVRLAWEVAARCTCWTDDSRQPEWGHLACGGFGVIYAAPVTVRGLFRSQARWTSSRVSGERGLGEAELTTPVAVHPGYSDRRVRDRFTVLDAPGDAVHGRVFFPAADAVPFVFAGVQRAWRVQLQALEQDDRVVPQP